MMRHVAPSLARAAARTAVRAAVRGRRWIAAAGLAALVSAVGPAPAAAQVPVEVTSTAPASGWNAPRVGETVTVRVSVGRAGAPVNVRFFGFKLFYNPDAYEVVSQTLGPLVAGVDLDDSDGLSDGLRIVRHDANVYGSGRNAFSVSVSLFGGAPLIVADGRAAFEVVLRVRAVRPPERYTLVPGEVDLRDAVGGRIEAASGVVRAVAVTGGSGVNPPPVTFPEAGGVTLDVATIGASATVTARHSEDPAGGLALPGTFVALTAGVWTFAISPVTAFAAEVCFPFTHVTVGVADRTQIRVHKRADAVSPWVELPTRLVPNAASAVSVCADVTAFSDFTITAPLDALPVELVSFTATGDGRGTVVLRWATASETDNAGFTVEHQAPDRAPDRAPGRAANAASTEAPWREVGFVAGNGTTAESHAYAHRVRGLEAGLHRFRLRQVDLDGAHRHSPTVEALVDPEDGLWLGPPTPNPAAAAATVRYTLARPAVVDLALYDMTGRRLARLASGAHAEGSHAAGVATAGLSDGLYVVRLVVGGAVRTTLLTVRH